MGQTPLFQVMFVLQNELLAGVGAERAAVSVLEVESGTAKFDLTLMVTGRRREVERGG